MAQLLGEALYPAQREQSAYPMQLIEQENEVFSWIFRIKIIYYYR